MTDPQTQTIIARSEELLRRAEELSTRVAAGEFAEDTACARLDEIAGEQAYLRAQLLAGLDDVAAEQREAWERFYGRDAAV
ncbi:MAG: hypothetical protein WD250_13175 [Egibacteraceae bacterium]